MTISRVETNKISLLLSEYFKKDHQEVKQMVNNYFNQFNFQKMTDLKGLVRIWAKVMAGLPEKDQIQEEQTQKLLKEIYQLFSSEWEEILQIVTEGISQKMKPFLS